MPSLYTDLKNFLVSPIKVPPRLNLARTTKERRGIIRGASEHICNRWSAYMSETSLPAFCAGNSFHDSVHKKL